MMELCLMASHGYPPGLAVGFNSEHGSSRVPEDFHHFLPYHASNKDLVNPVSFNLSQQQKEEWRSNGVLDSNYSARIDSMCKRPTVADFQDNRPDTALVSFSIAERCNRHEKILKLLSSGSIGEEVCLSDLSMLYDLMGPQSRIADLPQQPFVSCCFDDAQTPQSLVYPTCRELYFREPFLDLVGDNSIISP